MTILVFIKKISVFNIYISTRPVGAKPMSRNSLHTQLQGLESLFNHCLNKLKRIRHLSDTIFAQRSKRPCFGHYI